MPATTPLRSLWIYLVLLASWAGPLPVILVPCPAVGAETAEEFFETEIRPLLAEHCYECHSARAEKVQGGLLLDSGSALLTGGDSGPAVVPGDPEQSLLWQAVQYQGLEMPPSRRLPGQDLAKIERWIRAGAPFPGPSTTVAPNRARSLEITDEDRAYWAYQPIRRPSLPQIDVSRERPHGSAAETFAAVGFGDPAPIDYFLAARQQAVGITANPSATPQELVRRLYLDLLGIPPTLAQVEAFAQAPTDQAYAELVDHLLAQPQYGERWARYWLDVVRFAQTNGYERDGEKPLVWRYRDYVIDAFNQDKPFDRFIVEQLAGDELPDADAESIVATGFYHLGVWDDEPDDKRAAEFDGWDDILSTIGQAFLGQTIGCARCHNHMFDPIPQSDYYGMLAMVRNVRPFENARYAFDSANYLPLAPPAEVATFARAQAARRAELTERRAQATDAAEQQKLDEQLKLLAEDRGPFSDWALGVREAGEQPTETHLLVRGNAATPGELVNPHFLTVLGAERAVSQPQPATASSGLRTQLARWIASPQNPLTARVIANRVWQFHFGRGLVPTPNDFGRAGEPPSHPELLDWLAAELIDHGWSLKHLHRQILLSQAYRRTSAVLGNRAAEQDPDNHLLWRQQLRRLDAESLRDSILAATGSLNLEMHGRGVFPALSGEVLSAQSRPGWGWELSPGDQQQRRSVYLFTKRGVRDPLLETFDYGNTTSSVGVRAITTVAPQALVLLNGSFVQQQADQLAQQVVRLERSPAERVAALYERVLSRRPKADELARALAFVDRQRQAWESLDTVVTFRPEVPVALQAEYRQLLLPEHYFSGPRQHWTYFRGKWLEGYEAINALDEQSGPFGLWQGKLPATGSWESEWLADDALRFGSWLIGHAEQDQFRGWEIRCDVRDRTLSVWQHTAEGPQLVAEAGAELRSGAWQSIRCELTSEAIQIWLGAASGPGHSAAVQTGPTLTAAWTGPASEDQLGITASRGALSIRAWRLSSTVATGEVVDVLAGAQDKSPELRAWRSLGVVLLNSNEFLYVD